MRRIVSTLLVAMTFVGILFAQGVTMRHGVVSEVESGDTLSAPQSRSTQAKPAGKKRKVDYMADLVKPYNQGGDSVIYLVGDFAAHHNGAVIWCDSAVRYSDTRWGFFSRVVINQDSIFIYGDSAIYDGDAAHAEIYAPIIKVVDGDALLYTYNFSFNTETRVGQYTGGGVLVHDDNILESVRGYYDAREHNVICVERVELHGADYDMKSDSIIYNTQTEFARFFTSSEIWNADGEYLSADAGYYDRARDLYMITRNGYLLSEEQEMWGDTLEYHRANEHIIARNNIQMDDCKNKVMAFGDFAEYWQAEGNALLTRRPSAIGYDTSQSDTVFMRADSLWLLTIDPNKGASSEQGDSTFAASNANAAAASFTPAMPGGTTPPPMPSGVRPSSITTRDQRLTEALPMLGSTAPPAHMLSQPDTTSNVARADQNAVMSNVADIVQTADVNADSLRLLDSISRLPEKQRKAYEKEQAKQYAMQVKAQIKREEAILRKAKLDSIAMVRQAKINKQLDAAKAKELQRIAQDSVRRAERRAKLVARGKDVSALDREDSIAALRNARVMREMMTDSVKTDSVVAPAAQADSTEQKPAVEIKGDSIYRLVKAYRNVKMYRSDAQMVCDSLVSNSLDSVIHLYIEPVMWNQANQLVAEQVDIYTTNQQLQRAEFVGSPIMIAEVDTAYYNQVAGKSMTALFKNNEICRNDVDGNVQTIYFRTESNDSPLVVEMTYLESASASFFIENQQLVGITYRNEVPFTLYPLALIPASQPTKLDNFKWVPELRPTRDGVFDRELRPSEREERQNRKRPTFSIVEAMDRQKERLLMRGEWSDREDQLTPELVEWRNRHMERR
ncbi:MAG: hypothetical protein IKV33_01125 [Alistipes sp.]|nr:hypothetical protein [Alistipes sp.]